MLITEHQSLFQNAKQLEEEIEYLKVIFDNLTMLFVTHAFFENIVPNMRSVLVIYHNFSWFFVTYIGQTEKSGETICHRHNRRRATAGNYKVLHYACYKLGSIISDSFVNIMIRSAWQKVLKRGTWLTTWNFILKKWLYLECLLKCVV